MKHSVETAPGYGWVVVAVGALITCVAFGAVFSLAVFLQPVTEATGWSRAGVSAGYLSGFFSQQIFFSCRSPFAATAPAAAGRLCPPFARHARPLLLQRCAEH